MQKTDYSDTELMFEKYQAALSLTLNQLVWLTNQSAEKPLRDFLLRDLGVIRIRLNPNGWQGNFELSLTLYPNSSFEAESCIPTNISTHYSMELVDIYLDRLAEAATEKFSTGISSDRLAEYALEATENI